MSLDLLSLTLIDLPAVLDLGMFMLELTLWILLSVTLLSSLEESLGRALTELVIDLSWEPYKLLYDL
jgi:hypothetical protein